MKATAQFSKKTRREEQRKTCPGCEMPAIDWSGAGVTRNGERYCCEGCADGSGCTCEPRGRAMTEQP